MLRLLHKVRKELLVNKNLGGYLWYAIGEILLVVVGILIALQINNWNEERIEQNQVREYALALVERIGSIKHRFTPRQKHLPRLNGCNMPDIAVGRYHHA
ncbi:MAG: DUF6090 family protein [Xanthomonadales bacterium]|nr:DUF6090 family protein [Xanthomonadales bacterium]